MITMRTLAIPVIAVLICTSFGVDDTAAQAERQAYYEVLSPLVGGTWVINGTWSSGAEFRQERIHEWGLDGVIMTTKSFGPFGENGEMIIRNEGIRAWDSDTGRMCLWEFDRFGATIEGTIGLVENGFYYQYPYSIGGESRTLRDLWVKTGEDSYDLRIGIYEDDEWKEVFLETSVTRKKGDLSDRD